MTNNSPVYWTANGLSLHTMAWSVKSFGGGRFAGPAKVGDDLRVPFRRGRIRTRKSRDAKVYDLRMWVLPTTEDGKRSSTLTREQQAHENFRRIVAAVDIEDQFTLAKRWWDGSTIQVASALAEYVEGGGPSADDGTGFDFTITLILADPYFYAAPATVGTGLVTVGGEVPTDRYTLTFLNGENPRLTTPDGNWIQYQGFPSSGSGITIDMRTGLAMEGAFYVNGKIVRNPDFPDWPMLEPGLQNLGLTGGGTATIEYEAAYR